MIYRAKFNLLSLGRKIQNKLCDKNNIIIQFTVNSPQNVTDKKYNPPYRHYNPNVYTISPINTTKHLPTNNYKMLQLTKVSFKVQKYSMVTHLTHFKHIFKFSLNCAKVEHCLIIIGKLFKLITAITEKAEWPKSVALKFTAQSPLDEALVCLIFSVQEKTNSFKGEGARLLTILYINQQL